MHLSGVVDTRRVITTRGFINCSQEGPYDREGTHMAGLFQDIAPNASIYLAEVTRNWVASEGDLDAIANVARISVSQPHATIELEWLTWKYFIGNSLRHRSVECRHHFYTV